MFKPAFLLLCLLNVFEVLFKDLQLFQNATQPFALRLDSGKWQGVWDSTGKHLEQWAPPVLWNFSPEQVQNLERLVKYLAKLCCHPGNSRETKPTATCYDLAHAYWAMFNSIQCPWGQKKGLWIRQQNDGHRILQPQWQALWLNQWIRACISPCYAQGERYTEVSSFSEGWSSRATMRIGGGRGRTHKRHS